MKSVILPIAIGVMIKSVLLYFAHGHQGYFGGDAYSYMHLARYLLEGGRNTSEFYWPPGFPLIVAFYLKIFGSLLALSIVHIGLSALFAWWISKKISLLVSPTVGYAALWFFSLDPVWLVHSIIVGADFIGASIFGVLWVGLLDARKNYRPSKGLLLGLGFAAVAFIKPVFHWIPLFVILYFVFEGIKLKSKPIILFVIVFAAAWAVPLTGYRLLRQVHTGVSSFSGHNAMQFSKYIRGWIFVVQGKAENAEAGEKMASDLFNSKKESDPEFSYNREIMNAIFAEPKIFAKLVTLSLVRGVFGNVTSEFRRMLKPQPPPNLGLWVALSRGSGLRERLQGVDWFYLFNILFMILEKALVVGVAFYGTWRAIKQRRDISWVILTWICIGYFAATLIVFGDPRLFMPGTVLLFFIP